MQNISNNYDDGSEDSNGAEGEVEIIGNFDQHNAYYGIDTTNLHFDSDDEDDDDDEVSTVKHKSDDEDNEDNEMDDSVRTANFTELLASTQTKQTTVDKSKQSPVTLPADTRLITINTGFSITNIDMQHYDAVITSNTIMASAQNYIRDNAYRNKKLNVVVFRKQVEVDPTSTYGKYLTRLNANMEEIRYCSFATAYDEPDFKKVLLPLVAVGPDSKRKVFCGCCGDEIAYSESSIAEHIKRKSTDFATWSNNKWSTCPWCAVEFQNSYECLMHWFDGNHVTRSCFGIIGVDHGSVNDSRLQRSLPLPYSSIMQSAIGIYLRQAPTAIAILVQRVTQVDIANTQELASSLAIELANTDSGEDWLPDCPSCDFRYFKFNVVHYSSVAALFTDVEYHQRECGHIIPSFSAEQLRRIPLQFFQDLADKIQGKVKRYTCSTYRTAAKKDSYDDDDDTKKKFLEMVQIAIRTHTADTSAKFVEQNIVVPVPVQQAVMMRFYATYGQYLFMGKRMLEHVQWYDANAEDEPIETMQYVPEKYKQNYVNRNKENITKQHCKNIAARADKENRIGKFVFDSPSYRKANRYHLPMIAPKYNVLLDLNKMIEYRVPVYETGLVCS
jgi:hypothetical protein